MTATTVTPISYASARVPVRDDLPAAHRRAWERLARPGNWWAGAEHVAMAAEIRNAWSCPLCRERQATLSPYTVAGEHARVSGLPAPVIDVIHRVVTDPGRLTRNWFERTVAAGLSDAAYVEIIDVIVAVVSIDSFCRGIGVALHPLPEPVDGEPSRSRPPTACDEGAWVATVPSGRAGGADADIYAGLPGPAPNVIRALSLVPDAVRQLRDQLHLNRFAAAANTHTSGTRRLLGSIMRPVANTALRLVGKLCGARC